MRRLGYQVLPSTRLLVTVGFQHEPATGVVKFFVAAFAANRLVIGPATSLVVCIVAAQRRQGVSDVRFVRLGMRCHPKPSAGPDAVTVSHATHPLTLKSSWNTHIIVSPRNFINTTRITMLRVISSPISDDFQRCTIATFCWKHLSKYFIQIKLYPILDLKYKSRRGNDLRNLTNLSII